MMAHGREREEAVCFEGVTDRRGILMIVLKGGERIHEGLGFLRRGEGKRGVFTGRKPLSQVRGQRERVGREGAGKGGHAHHRHRPLRWARSSLRSAGCGRKEAQRAAGVDKGSAECARAAAGEE